MSRRSRRNHSPAFKAKVALAALRGEQTLAELAHSGSRRIISRCNERSAMAKELDRAAVEMEIRLRAKPG